MVTREDIESGFLARSLPVVVTREITRKRLMKLSPAVSKVREGLFDALQQMHVQMGGSAKALDISVDAVARLDDAERALERWAQGQYHADLIGPWARRLAEYAERLAIIFAVSEGAADVDVMHVIRALKVVDQAKADVSALVGELVKGQGARKLDRYAKYIRSHPGVSQRNLQRATGDMANAVTAAVAELVAQGRIREGGSDGRRGYWPVGVSDGQVSDVSGKSDCSAGHSATDAFTTDPPDIRQPDTPDMSADACPSDELPVAV
jgi:hypothetical protein